MQFPVQVLTIRVECHRYQLPEDVGVPVKPRLFWCKSAIACLHGQTGTPGTKDNQLARPLVSNAPCPPSPCAAPHGSRPRTGNQQRPARFPASLQHFDCAGGTTSLQSPQQCTAQNLCNQGQSCRARASPRAGNTFSQRACIAAQPVALQTRRKAAEPGPITSAGSTLKLACLCCLGQQRRTLATRGGAAKPGAHPWQRRQEAHVRHEQHAREILAEHLLRAWVALALQDDLVACLAPQEHSSPGWPGPTDMPQLGGCCSRHDSTHLGLAKIRVGSCICQSGTKVTG